MVRKYCKLIFFIAAVAALVIYLPQTVGLFKIVVRAFKPVLIALFLALVFHVPINFLYGKVLKFIKNDKVRYAVSLTAIYVLAFGILAFSLYLVVPEFINSIKGFSEKLPEYSSAVRTKMNALFSGLGIGTDKVDGIFESILQKLTAGGNAAEALVQKTGELLGGIMTLFFAVILSVYILLDRKRLIRQIRQFTNALFPVKVSKMLDKTVTVGGVIFAKFLGGQFIEAALLAVLTFLGMLALSLPYAPLISVLVFIFNLVPMLGAYVSGALGFVLIAFVSIRQAVIFIIFSVILQQFENNVTYPKVVGNSLGLSGFWVMASVLVGGALFGFWGIMIGVPAVAVVCKLLGYRLKNDDRAGTLIHDLLEYPDKPTGGDCSEKGGDEGNNDCAP